MPYEIAEMEGEFCVMNKETGEKVKCHPTMQEAQDHMAALYANVEDAKSLDDSALVAFGGAVKALGSGKIGGYLIRYGSPDDVDLEGDYFDATTDYGDADKSAVYYDHGMDAVLGRRVIGKGILKRDDVGIWIEAQLELRDEYEKAIYHLAEKNKLGWSSGSAAHLIEKERIGRANHIKRWPLGLDASTTPTPAEPRNTVISLKSFKATALADLQAEPQDAGAPASAQATAAKTEATGNEIQIPAQSNAPSENDTMGEEIKSVLDAVTALGEQVKAQGSELATIKKALEHEPPVNGNGGMRVQVDPDEKRPYKSFKKNGRGQIVDATGFGEFLQDVAVYGATKSVTPRLAAVIDANAKAMKATGLNVAIPSQGGFFVQTDHSQEIVSIMFEQGKILSRVRRVPLGPNADSITLNGVDETSRASTLYGGIVTYWIEEATAPNASKPKFRQIKLEVHGLGALYYATDKLMRTASALGALVGDWFRGAMVHKVEDAIFNGDGAGKPLGLLSATLLAAGGSTISVAKEAGQAAASVVYENFSKMYVRLLDEVSAGASWFINRDVHTSLDQIYKVAGTEGLPPDFVTYGPDRILRIKNLPVEETVHCQTLGTQGDVILWNPSTYLFADLGSVEEASSIHVAFTTAEQCFRFLYYCDGQPMLAQALTPEHGSSTMSTQVVLDTRS